MNNKVLVSVYECVPCPQYRVSFIQHLKVVRHIDSSAIPRTGYN